MAWWRDARFGYTGLIPRVARVRVASRAWCLLAAAMLRWPAIFMIPTVRLRSVAMTWGALLRWPIAAGWRLVG